ncbi:DMT family transporter [Lonsdalea quercina]|uniref:DMT family transporter n=1 Tax=Lonsdalea quercina TaxID=71657 RepID=UPI003974E8C1
MMNKTSLLFVPGLFLLAPLLFSGNMVVARWISPELPPLTLAFARWLFAAIVIFPFILSPLRRAAPTLRRRGKDVALLVLLGGVLSVTPQYAAAHHTSAGHIALMFSLSPIMVSVIERVVWRIPLHANFFIGASIAFLGICVVVFEGDITHLLRFEFNQGDMTAFIASTAWAGYTALLRQRPIAVSAFVLLWIIAIGSSVILLPFLPLEWRMTSATPKLSAHLLYAVLFLALVAGVAAYSVYSRIVNLLGAARASTSMYMVPVYAFILSSIFLQEQLYLYHLTATTLVLLGVALTTVRSIPHLKFPAARSIEHRTH